MRQYLLFATFMLLLLNSCKPGSGNDTDDATKWRVSLGSTEMNPYGTWLARQTLQDYFPQAEIKNLNRSFRYNNLSGHAIYHGGDSVVLLVMEGLSLHITEEEWTTLKTFVSEGNELLIFCSSLDEQIMKDLDCKLNRGDELVPLTKNYDGSVNQHILELADSSIFFGYTGRSLEGNFSVYERGLINDSTFKDSDNYDHSYSDYNIDKYPEILGFRAKQMGEDEHQANFVRYKINKGHLTLHAAPLVLSNYFLLQNGNRDYLDYIWHSLPDNISNVYWNVYFNHTPEEDNWSVLFRYPTTRWAFLLALATLLLYVIFEARRRQRIIPVIPPLQNASVSFVETVGQLYYNQGNHANLAEKMSQHFLEWVRNHYHLDTNDLNADFIRQLAHKSGTKEDLVKKVVEYIQYVRSENAQLTDDQLHRFHDVIQSFYNKTRTT